MGNVQDTIGKGKSSFARRASITVAGELLERINYPGGV